MNPSISPGSPRPANGASYLQGTKRLLPGVLLAGLLLTGLVITGLILPRTASAAEPELIGTFGESTLPSGEPEISRAGSIAVNESTNTVYLADINADRVMVYKPTGDTAELISMFGGHVNQTKAKEKTEGKHITEEEEDVCTVESHDECGIGVPGPNPGEFGTPSGIAVDQTTGDVYLADTGNDRIQEFTETGQYITQIDSEAPGIPHFYLPEVSPDLAVEGDGDLLTLDWESEGGVGEKQAGPGRVLQFTPAGIPTGLSFGPALFGTEKLKASQDVAADAPGNVYVGRIGGNVVKFDSAGEAVSELPDTTRAESLAVDPFSGSVFITGPSGAGEVMEFGGAGSGHEGEEIAHFAPVSLSFGMAYDVVEGKLYVSDAGARRVSVFGLFATPAKGLPVVESESVLGVRQTSVALNADIDPDGEPTTYAFEYSTDKAFRESVRVAAGVPAGSPENVFSPQAVSTDLAGLQADELYYYRAVAHSAFHGGETVEGPVESFATAAEPAGVLTGAASAVTQDSAVLGGMVTPGSQGVSAETLWCVQYGTNTTYNIGWAPLSAGSAGQGTASIPVSVQVTGLRPDALYHFRLVAVNSLGLGLGAPVCGTPGGVESYGADEMFTTSSPPPPSVETGTASEVTQSNAVLSGFIDGHDAQTSYEFDLGTDTTYGTRIFARAGLLSGLHKLSMMVVGLQPGVTYHFRLVAFSVYGISYGGDSVFRTANASPVALAPSAAPLIGTTPMLNFPNSYLASTATSKPLTRAERLTNALRTCRKSSRTSSSRRSCEKKARRTYGKTKK
jgi:DNA-binding beta-propeller fold protein YncE